MSKSLKSKKLNSVQVARSWLDMGIQPVPLKPHSKKPKTGKGWNTLQVEEDTIPQFFKKGDNIGGLWGEPSGWIIDVDLDWDEAVWLAPLLLPETFIYGRKSRPMSHYLYRCREIAGTKRKTARKENENSEVIVEIRSTGSQTVLPPSIHPDNERYEINHDVLFTEIPRIELKRLVDELAAGAMLIRYFPGRGRHDYIHTVTGSLLWSGWIEARVRKFVKALITVTERYDDESDQRRRTLENTIEHFRKGNRISGWNTLSEWIPGPDLQLLKKWLTPPKNFEEPPKHVEKPHLESTEIPAFGKALLEVPGLVGELKEWSAKRSFLKQPAFDLACALMCTAVASSNKYLVQGWDTPLQPYFMLLAPTSAGKGASLESVYAFSRQINLHEHVYQGFQSYYALLDRLAEPPNMACWLWDEAARHLAAARSPGSPDFSTLSHLISLYGRANSDVPAMPGRKLSIPSLERPFLTVFATTQPKTLIESLSVSQISTGFVNRLVLFDSGDGAPRPNLQREDIFSSAIRNQALKLRNHEPTRQATTVRFSNPTYAHFRDFDTHARERTAADEENEIWGRAAQNALVVAGIVAVGVNPKRPEITPEIARWAIALIRWSIGCWTARTGQTASRSHREKHSKRVEGYIRRARQLQHRGRSTRYIELMEKGQMPRAVLQRLCRDLASRELDDVLDQLIEGELIGITEDGKGLITFWPKTR